MPAFAVIGPMAAAAASASKMSYDITNMKRAEPVQEQPNIGYHLNCSGDLLDISNLPQRLSDKDVNELLGQKVTPYPLLPEDLRNDMIFVVDEDSDVAFEHYCHATGQGIERWFIPSRRITIEQIKDQIDTMFRGASSRQGKRVYFTPIGLGQVGVAQGLFTVDQIADAFFNRPEPIPDNVWLPQEIWDARKLVYPAKIEKYSLSDVSAISSIKNHMDFTIDYVVLMHDGLKIIHKDSIVYHKALVHTPFGAISQKLFDRIHSTAKPNATEKTSQHIHATDTSDPDEFKAW
jgi:hypothetical protein